MRDRQFSLRDMDPGEKYVVSILLVQALFLGIFIGAFDIGAHSLFLSVFDEKILAKGYIASGFAGLILLTAYFLIQPATISPRFLTLSLLAVGIITLLVWMAVSFYQSDLFIFLAFILFGPLNIITIIGFRANALAAFSRINRLKLLALPDIFLILGIIISCFVIPMLLYYRFLLNNVLLISAISVLAAAVILIIPGKRSVAAFPSHVDKTGRFRKLFSGLNIFRGSSFTKFLAVFMIISVVSAFFVQYSFLAVTRLKFESGTEIARFLGIFTGTLMIIALAARLILYSNLLRSFGLKISLIITPFLLACITIVIIAAGLVFGYTRESAAGFTVFFILLAVLRFSSRAMEEAIESQSLKLLYVTIDERIRNEIHILMDSAVRKSAVLLAGMILAGAGTLSFIRLIHIPVILFLILLLWIYVAFRLYSEYRQAIKTGLDSLRRSASERIQEKTISSFNGRFCGERLFRLDYYNLVSGDYSLLENSGNKFYFLKILDHAVTRKDINLQTAVKKMTSSHFDPEIRKHAVAFVKSLESPSVQIKEDDRIQAARRALSGTRMPQTTEILRLLRDKSIESKRLAIYLIGKFKLSDMLTEVCECLNIQGLEVDTTTVLGSFGNAAEEELIRFYLVSSGNLNTSKTILRLLAKLPMNEGSGFLFSRLWSNSRQLKEVALQCLTDSNFKPTAEDRERLNMLISEITGVVTWTLAAKSCLEKNNDKIILQEMNKELARWNGFLVSLLDLTYDAEVLREIRKNLETGTVESVHYAHSIIDIFFDESVKSKIIYLLDVSPDNEKLKNLNRFFPVELPDYNNLLEDILNRDYNLLSLWTRACVLRYMPGIKTTEMAESVAAILFSPESLLQEEAVKLIARSDVSLYRSVYNRISIPVRKNLDRIIEGETKSREFLFDKVMFLLSYFEGIVEDDMIFLARKMTYYGDIKDAVSSLPDGFMLWVIEPGDALNPFSIVYSSRVEELMEKVSLIDRKSAYVLSFKALDEFLYQHPGYEEIVLSKIADAELSA